MSFSLLHPFFLLGALGVAVPIYLHLKRREPHNLIRFSAVRFLDDNPHPRKSPWRLRDILLFLVRLCSLLALIAAFAWPYLREEGSFVVKESRVYILDNTLSRQAEGGFVRDREQLTSLIRGAGRELQIAVIELKTQPSVIAGFSENHEAAEQKTKNLQPSYQRGSFLPAFRLANTLLQNSLGEKKRIILLTDNQENQWSENLNVPPFLKDVEVEIPKTPHRNLPNLSVAEAKAQRIFLGEKALVNFTAEITHQGKIAEATVILRINDQEVMNKKVSLADKPERFVFQTQWEASPSLALSGVVEISGEDDSMAADNSVYFSLPPVQEGKVAVLCQSQFLRLALSPEIMRGHWDTHFIEPSKIAAELETANDAEVLCIESSYLQSADARKLLWRYITNGRGVFLMMNRVTAVTKGFVKELGFECLPEDSSKAGSANLQYLFANHPVFHPFTSPDYGNIMEVKVTDPIRLRSTQAVSLLFSDKGEPLFFQNVKQPGKLFVSAFAFERNQTSWPVHPTFIPFLDLCLQNARPSDPMPTSFEPGEVFIQNLGTNSLVREVVLKTPTGMRSSAVLHGKLQLLIPEKPGLYSLTYRGVSDIERIIAVNASPKESQLRFTVKPDALQAWQMISTSSGAKQTAGLDATPPNISSIWQQKIWWFLLVAALCGLALEGFWVHGRRKTA
ncbi:MAG: hypothetical protein JWN25_732 [Verrucomicrobiales bacterium]|nr:hypothetical protein [Verrucomicrobiales bacterium]